jgi:predicted nucleotidyltransferase component of viral defense system
LILSYGEDDVNIKIDITRNTRNHNTYEVTNFYGTSIRVQDQATLCANKLVALTERHTNRDIYDVHFFLKKGFPVNEEVIQERT